MNRGSFGFPRSGALDLRSLRVRTADAQTITASTRLRVPGASASSTGIRLVNDSDLGTLFLPAPYTAVQTASVSNSGDGVNPNGPLISGSISGSHLTLVRNTNCNCNCACSTDS